MRLTRLEFNFFWIFLNLGCLKKSKKIYLEMMLVLSQSFGAAYGPGPCDGAMKSALWCDTSKDFKTRAAMIVANLTADEKSGL